MLSRVKTAVRADHIFLTSVSRSKLSRIPYICRWGVIDREIVGHADIEFLTARRQIFPPVEVIIGNHIAPGDTGFYLGLYCAVATGRTETRGLDRSVLCDQCRSAQILVRTVRRIAPREFRGSLPHLRNIVGISPSVVFRNARPISRSAGTRCGIHLLRVGGRTLIRIRHHDVERDAVPGCHAIRIQSDAGLIAVRIFTQKVIAVRLKRRGQLAVVDSHLPGKGHAVVRGLSA